MMKDFEWGDNDAIVQGEGIEEFDPHLSLLDSFNVCTTVCRNDCFEVFPDHDSSSTDDCQCQCHTTSLQYTTSTLIDRIIDLEGSQDSPLESDHTSLPSNFLDNISDDPGHSLLVSDCPLSNYSSVLVSPQDMQLILEELQSYVESPTDPVGKFMRKLQMTPEDAIRWGVFDRLIEAPRKQRAKYGKRREVSHSDRAVTCRARNREHARATRVRKRIFREIEAIVAQRQQTERPQQDTASTSPRSNPNAKSSASPHSHGSSKLQKPHD
eukprot:scaffold1769_cov164-Ochromonas_danica.AAC.18